jgi:hypothetical protein
MYLSSTLWMIWCSYDIIRFRRRWTSLISSAKNPNEYRQLLHQHVDHIEYFPDINHNSGLFMRFGAGSRFNIREVHRCYLLWIVLCLGSLLLTVIESAQTLERVRVHSQGNVIDPRSDSSAISISKAITFICRFVFHCVQFFFLFRYGNVSERIGTAIISRIYYYRSSSIDIEDLPILVLLTW